MLGVLIAAAEPSKVPVYIAGGVFAAWAVVLGYVGLNRASFPYNVGGQRAVIAVSLLLAVLAVAMAVVTDP